MFIIGQNIINEKFVIQFALAIGLIDIVDNYVSTSTLKILTL
jgi:hypothetical protein